MVAKLQVLDGSPVWASNAIIPSRDTVVSPTSSPTLASINVGATGVFVYVKVDNTGDVDFGTCACSPVPAPWAGTTALPGFLATTTGGAFESRAGETFEANYLGDSLTGTVNFSFGLSASGRRAWGWSPDGRLFAWVGSPNGNDWYLTIVTLAPLTRSDGTILAAGHIALQANGLFNGPWNASNFAWAGSKAVIASGVAAGGGQTALVVACPESPGGASYGDLLLNSAGQIDYVYLVSPCGSVVAVVPKILNAAAGSRDAYLVSTATAVVVPFKINNAPTSVTIVGLNPSLTTLAHGARGTRVNTGSGATVDVDDPDCTLVGGGVRVTVDRVKASTLPSGNLGVIAVGTGSALGSLLHAHSAWVQVVNSNGWANQSEPHWCLLAQAYTADDTTIPKPWNGQLASPPAFPIALINCAQRNIQILP
jgi:hypothetical protein